LHRPQTVERTASRNLNNNQESTKKLRAYSSSRQKLKVKNPTTLISQEQTIRPKTTQQRGFIKHGQDSLATEQIANIQTTHDPAEAEET